MSGTSEIMVVGKQAVAEPSSETANSNANGSSEAAKNNGSYPAIRRRLPDERHSLTHHFSIGGQEGYVTVGLYEAASEEALASICSGVFVLCVNLWRYFISSGSRFSPYGDTVNLSRCFYSPHSHVMRKAHSLLHHAYDPVTRPPAAPAELPLPRLPQRAVDGIFSVCL